MTPVLAGSLLLIHTLAFPAVPPAASSPHPDAGPGHAVHVAPADTTLVTAGSGAVDGRRLHRGRWTRQVQMVAGDQVTPIGTLTQELRDARYGGRSGLLSVIRFETPGGATVDTSFADARSLAPIAHRSHNAARVMVLDFDGRAVSGRVEPTEGAATDIEERTEVPVFDSNVGDLVIAALPLEAGYHARVPLYIHEQGGLVWHDVVVTGTEESPEPVWVVEMRPPDGGRVVEYRIARATRQVVRLAVTLPDGRVIRYAPPGGSD